MPESYVDPKSGERLLAPKGRYGAVAFALNGKGYVGLGYSGTNFLKDFWEYDPNGVPDADDYPSLPEEVKAKFGTTSCGSWRKIADYPGDSCRYAVAFVLTKKDGTTKAYVGTGQDFDYNQSDLFYSFDGEKWESVPPCGTGRRLATAFTYTASDGIEYGYLAGGTDNDGKQVTWFQRFNPETNSWENLRDLYDHSTESYDDKYYEMALSSAVSFVLPADSKHDAKAYVTAGYNGFLTTDCWEYDLEADLWKQKQDFEGRHRQKAVSFVFTEKDEKTGETIHVPYVTTGSTPSTFVVGAAGYFYSDLWKFEPFSPHDKYD